MKPSHPPSPTRLLYPCHSEAPRGIWGGAGPQRRSVHRHLLPGGPPLTLRHSKGRAGSDTRLPIRHPDFIPTDPSLLHSQAPQGQRAAFLKVEHPPREGPPLAERESGAGSPAPRPMCNHPIDPIRPTVLHYPQPRHLQDLPDILTLVPCDRRPAKGAPRGRACVRPHTLRLYGPPFPSHSPPH